MLMRRLHLVTVNIWATTSGGLASKFRAARDPRMHHFIVFYNIIWLRSRIRPRPWGGAWKAARDPRMLGGQEGGFGAA